MTHVLLEKKISRQLTLLCKNSQYNNIVQEKKPRYITQQLRNLSKDSLLIFLRLQS